MCKKILVSFFTLFLSFLASQQISAQQQDFAQAQPSTPQGSSLHAKELELLAQLPLVPRELRGVWLVTVHNIDWPSNPLDPPAKQQAELLSLFDRAQDMGINAIFFQVRDVSDAFYKSDIEPWSAFLTGEQGRAPEPFWDPLEFAITEAHKRGMELHAWLNPYRVGYLNQKRFAPQHIMRQRPDLVRRYGKSYWLDPGNPETIDYIVSIIRDICSRYKVDGIHLDDYFYPYPEAGLIFKDQITHKVFGPEEDLSNWRRENINRLIETAYRAVKSINPYISFGVSPFAIWQNDQPKGVQGLESYTSLYADSKKWLQNAWVDYLAPQFYWSPNAPRQPYDKLLAWWLEQNTQQRHLIAGVNVANISGDQRGTVDFSEIQEKISLRRDYQAGGEILYSLGKIDTDDWQKNIRSLYPYQALPSRIGPKMDPMPAPQISLEYSSLQSRPVWKLTWANTSSKAPKYWVMYYRRNGIWEYKIYPTWVKAVSIPASQDLDPRYFAVGAVDAANDIGSVSWFGSIPTNQIIKS